MPPTSPDLPVRSLVQARRNAAPTMGAPPTHLAAVENLPSPWSPHRMPKADSQIPQHVEDGSDQPDTEPVADEPDPVAALPEVDATRRSESNPAMIEGLQIDAPTRSNVHRLRQAFEEMTADKSGSPDLAIALRQYLTAAGVEFGTTNALTGFGDSGRAWQSPTGRSLLFNELNGRLLIRATAAEHALVVEALELVASGFPTDPDRGKVHRGHGAS